MPLTTADAAGVAVGVDTVRPFMNVQNAPDKIAAFAAEFRSWFDNDKEKALSEYEFGTIGKKSTIPFASNAGKNSYINDAMNVGDHVKSLLREELVENYFSATPKPMRFSIGITDKEGGDLEIGIVRNSDRQEFISVRILCMKPGP